VAVRPGLAGKTCTSRELRQSFVYLLSDERVPLEVISRPVVESGVDAMDRIFPPSSPSER